VFLFSLVLIHLGKISFGFGHEYFYRFSGEEKVKIVELKRTHFFPSEEQEKEGIFLSGARSLAVDRHQNIYITDDRAHKIFVFDSSGKYVKTIGRHGQGPGEFDTPGQTYIGSDDKLYVNEVMSLRFQVCDLNGVQERSWHQYHVLNSFVVNAAGEIFGAPISMGPDREPWRMVRVYDREGKLLRKFGEPITTWKPMHTYNEGTIDFSPSGDLFFAYCFLPIVRKYDSKGTLLAEYNLSADSLLLKNAENFNLAKNKEENTFRSAINRIRCGPESFFIITGRKKTEILEYDFNGRYLRTYQYVSPINGATLFRDMIVRDIGGVKTFFLMMFGPEYRVEVCVPAGAAEK
jgi:hypothetical protein